MIFPWQRLRSSDEIIACVCGSTLPALPQAPLCNMVRRGTRIIRINTGSRMQCIACGLTYYVKTEGQNKGLIRIQRDADTGPRITQPEADELAKKLKKIAPVYARDEMRDPP